MTLSSYRISDFRKKLTEAFKLLRKDKIIARQNFWCCQSCACYAIEKIIKILTEKGKTVQGYCYYHSQDNESLQKGNSFFLAFGNALHNSVAETEKEKQTLEVGKKIVKLLNGQGIQTEWNETSGTRIKVITD